MAASASRNSGLATCAGAFFNPGRCERQVSANARVCAHCHSFEVPRARIMRCRRCRQTPFSARKRLIRVDDLTLNLRFFSMGEDGLVVFEDDSQARTALDTWPRELEPLDNDHDAVQFVKCHWCRRKVHPSLLSSCTKPSCEKLATAASVSATTKSKKRSLRRTSDRGEDSVPDDEKRRRQWRICKPPVRIHIGLQCADDVCAGPEQCSVNPFGETVRAVIQSPEELDADTVGVTFGGRHLRRDVDFFCGLREIVIPNVPRPAELVGDRTAVQVDVLDGNQNVSGSVLFTFCRGSDLDEQIQRLLQIDLHDGSRLLDDTIDQFNALSPLFPDDDVDLRPPQQ